MIAHAISADGSRIVFSTDAGQNLKSNIYDRLNGTTTVEVSASQRTPSAGSASAQYQDASVDGSHVLFTSEGALTNDAVPGSGQNLYDYDVETGRLTDLTAANDARVQGLAGLSEDASHVYFVAEGVLAANSNSHGDTASRRTAEPLPLERRSDDLHRHPRRTRRRQRLGQARRTVHPGDPRRRLPRLQLDGEPDRLRQHRRQHRRTGHRDLPLRRRREPADLRVVQPERGKADRALGSPLAGESVLYRRATSVRTAAACSSPRATLCSRAPRTASGTCTSGRPTGPAAARAPRITAAACT